MQERKIIQGAFVVSLLLHLLLAAATWRIPLYPEPGPAMARDSDREIEMVILPEQAPAEPAEDTMPTAYTEIPDRLAVDTPPEDPDYLAMHHALAADNVLGGDGNKPTAQQEWDFEQVAINKETLEGGDGVTLEQRPPPPAAVRGSSAAGREQGELDERDSDRTGAFGDWDLADPRQAARGEDSAETTQGTESPSLENWWGDQQPSILKQGQAGQAGDRGYDFDQDSRGDVTSGVAFDGQFSLNTYQWDYAPWMKIFTNELHRHWVPPYAYRLGILDGHTVIKLVVGLDGRIRSLEVVETEGHESLHEASVAALKAFAPYKPLPAQFPEENLVITLGLYYPALRR